MSSILSPSFLFIPAFWKFFPNVPCLQIPCSLEGTQSFPIQPLLEAWPLFLNIFLGEDSGARAKKDYFHLHILHGRSASHSINGEKGEFQRCQGRSDMKWWEQVSNIRLPVSKAFYVNWANFVSCWSHFPHHPVAFTVFVFVVFWSVLGCCCEVGLSDHSCATANECLARARLFPSSWVAGSSYKNDPILHSILVLPLFLNHVCLLE